MPKLIDLTGMRFGRLTVLRRSECKALKPKWDCICDCGASVVGNGADLKSGRHASCGCLHRESVTKHGATKHGGVRTIEYSCWMGMKQRCHNHKSTAFPWYGAKGITVCQRWRDSFSAFIEDMGHAPSSSHTIDRRDGTLGYSKENCRWATKVEQARNRCTNRIVEYQGIRQTVREWIIALNLSEDVVRSRLKLGWTFKRAVESPVNRCAGRSDISGHRFGSLRVISYSHTRDKRAFWICLCDCGESCIKSGKDIRNGHTKSCGCQKGAPGKPKPRK